MMHQKKTTHQKEQALVIQNVSKSFKIPHEKAMTLRSAFVSLFAKKTYEKFKALDDISFSVGKGEFVGIIGRNGSGKSTLLKILANVYSADCGHIKINGLVSPFLELGIGFNPELSGRDNIYLNATVLGLSREEIDKKYQEIVRFSEIERFIDQKVKNYSSGMKSRLAFAVAIHANRDILLMDEVLAVGDEQFKKKCYDTFHDLRKSKTIIFVTHSLAIAEEFCDRVIVLDQNRIVAQGDPEEMVRKYKERIDVKSKLPNDA